MSAIPPTTDVAPPRATRREWVALGVIALPCLVYAMDLTVLNLALPAISADLRPTASQLLWIVDIYGFMVAGLLITMGTLGDKLGRRRLLMVGAAAFAAASVAAALSTSAHALIATRALLGVAGATLAPSTLSLISNMFRDERERRVAIGIWISSYSVGGSIGPLVGGVILQYFAWPAIFWAAVPVMLLLLALGPFLLPEYRDPEAGRLDFVSVALSLAAVLGGVFALKQAAEGQLGATTWMVAAAGLAAGVAFVRRQRRIDYPLLDLQLFGQPRFAAAICTYALTSFAMFGVYIFISQHLQLVLGLSPLVAGLCTVPWALSFVVGSMLTPAIAQRHTAPTTMVSGLAVAAIGFAGVTLVDGPHGLVALIVGMTLMGIGMAPVFTLGNDIVISAAPPERAGAASALSETSAELSGALGIAVFGSLATSLYRAGMAGQLPADLPAGAVAEASTLGGALIVAAGLPAPLADALRTAARAAFVDGLQAAAVVGTGIMVVSGLLAWRMLRAPASTRPH
ncbi:MFS transporter [Hydrogenophaga laconesensis]|uniref:DHA2 family multidrug resistance protein-like MFS transporter n=1 Tax=Hydrogenophaga laconesensis TaxID=1805971 RepID=A0ABU1VCM5_9BURK|nr:MFS transporter [Hydrogenophaga laconesensis]MDR7095222.1 DHA2 family multidrug resistance protein-like MFS transporter [Hydrogenophaga laconesensis]